MKAKLFACAAAVVALAGHAHAQAAATAVDRAVAAYRRLNSVRAEFAQTINNPVTGTRLTSRGEFLRRGSDRLAIIFSDPAEDRIVADGRFVWVYVPSTAPGQVLKLSSGNPNATRMDPAAQFLDSPRTRFTITDGGVSTLNGRRARQVVLVPRSNRGPFTRARVWIDERDGLIRQFEVTEASGLVRHVTITRLRTNVAVPDRLFRFTPPAGVRVVDQAMLGGR